MDQYDDQARLTFHLALEEANLIGLPVVPVHLLLAILRSDEDLRQMFGQSPDDLDSLRSIALQNKDGHGNPQGANTTISDEVRNIVKRGVEVARYRGARIATNKDLALSLFSSEDAQFMSCLELLGIERSSVLGELGRIQV